MDFEQTRRTFANTNGPPSPGGYSNRSVSPGRRTGIVTDPAAVLRITLDPELKNITPEDWPYQMLNAILSGDSEFLDMTLKSEAANSSLDDILTWLTSPVGGSSGQTLLHIAALMNRPAVLEVLFSAVDRALALQSARQKTSVREQSAADKEGSVHPVEHKAALGRELDKIERLFHIKSEQEFLKLVSTADNKGRSLLHYAAAARGVMVASILRYKLDRFRKPMTSEVSPPMLPLFPDGAYVCPSTGTLWDGPGADGEERPDYFIAVRDLLRARNDPMFVDAKDFNKATALHYATVANDVRGIRTLLEFGAEAFSVTAQGATPLELAENKAVRNALVPIENALQLSVGMKMARPGMPQPMGERTVAFARTATASARGDRRGPYDEDGDGATTVAMRRSAAEKALEFLVNAGEDINGRTGTKLQAPLHVAVGKGSVEVVKRLLSNGAIVDVVDVNGCTPMHLAAELGTEAHIAIVQLLYENGANVNATSSVRKTPLHMSAAGGPHFTPGQKLVPKEPKVDENGNVIEASPRLGEEDEKGGTSDGNSHMISLLAELGANLEAQDVEGNTPLIAAAKRGNHLAVHTLLVLGARIYASNIRGHTALHTAAFAANLPVVRQLVRWDAELGKLKYMLDTSGRSSYDMAADADTREALHTLFEACASGQLDLVQSVQRQARLLPPTAAAPWLPVRPFETTRLMGRTPMHCVITGAAKAMAQLRKDHADNRGKPQGVAALAGSKSNKVAEALSKAIVQRRERERHPDPMKGTGIPTHKLAPSACRIVAGVGLRFVPVPWDPNGPFPAYEYLAWGGSFSDVVLTFPELKDPHAVAQWVDRYAFVPRPNAHKVFINKALLGEDPTRSEAARKRVAPGNELTTTPTEKEFGRVLDFLIRGGQVDMDAGDVDGVTALMLACKYGLLYIVRKLVVAGAKWEMADSKGNTALHYCYAYNQPAAAGILMGDPDTSGQMVLTEHWAGVLENCPNADGLSPLQVAGQGIRILPDSAERLVNVPRFKAKSLSMGVTKAM